MSRIRPYLGLRLFPRPGPYLGLRLSLTPKRRKSAKRPGRLSEEGESRPTHTKPGLLNDA